MTSDLTRPVPDGHGEDGTPVVVADDAAALRQTVADLRRKVAELEERERKVMALLNSPSPSKIDHDLRNVMNELVLLRKVLEQEEG